ncbi:MAG: hypothetical protein R3C03_09110 [Pirellulaceae bacterium]
MIRLLFRLVIPLVLLIAAFLVGYNYFWGTSEEQQQSRLIIAKFKDLGNDVFGLLKSEQTKYGEGKYDEALAKISAGIAFLKEKASSNSTTGTQFSEQVQALEQQKAAIESQVANLGKTSAFGGLMQYSSSSSVGQPDSTLPPSNSIEQIESQIQSLAQQTQQLGMSWGK